VNPDFNEFLGVLELSRVGNKESLENVTNVSDVEFVVEVNSSLSELLHNARVKHQVGLDDQGSVFLHLSLEVFQVASQESVVNYEKRFVIREGNRHQPEVTLVSGVHIERTS